MKLYVLCGYNIYETGDIPNLYHYYTNPTLEELKEQFKYQGDIDNKLVDLLDGMPVEIGDYEYVILEFELDNNKLLEQINKSEE